jgi:MFS family permease
MGDMARKIILYVDTFFLVTVLYFMKRSFGTVEGMLKVSLGVKEGLVTLIPAMFLLAFLLGSVLGPRIDRKPIRWLFVGLIGTVVGFAGCSFSVYHFFAFLFFSALTAVSSSALYYVSNSFLARADGLGRTWDFLSDGLSRTFAPVIFAIPVVLFVTKEEENLFWIFMSLSVIVAFLGVFLYLSVRNLPYKKNSSARFILHWWIKKRDYWGNLLIGLAYELTGAIIGTHYRTLSKGFGGGKKEDISLLLVFCACSFVGRFFWITFGHKISTRLGLVGGAAFMVLGFLLMPLGLTNAYLGMAIVGFGAASGIANHRCYVGDRYGQEQLISRVGSIGTPQCVISAAMLSSTGWLYQFFGNFKMAFWGWAVFIVFIIVFFISERNIEWASPKNSKMEILRKEGSL